MIASLLRQLIVCISFVEIILASPDAWARLPKPVKIQGTVLAIDPETRTLVFKERPNKKPFLFDWDDDTVFSKAGESARAADLPAGTTVIIHYKDLSFRHPLLTKIIWPIKDGG
jgi:hypothetical protein